MDTKLKNRSVSFNFLVIVISMIIILITGYLGITRYYYSKSAKATMYMICISIILALLLGIFFINKNYKLEYKENIICLFYSKLFIEIRILLMFNAMNLIAYLHEISNYRDFFTYKYISSFFICLLLIYSGICDIYRISLITKKDELEKYIKEKSLIYYIYNKLGDLFIRGYKQIKTTLVIKSSKKRLILELVFLIIYVSFLLRTAYYIGLRTAAFIGYYSSIWDIFINMNVTMAILIFVGLILTAIFVIFIFVFENDINHIKLKTDRISNNNYSNKININDIKILKDIANDIENIEVGFNKAIEEAIKSERMKGELITNVSHDLKTPLTSIISYIDFLDKDNISEEEKKKYISILKERSNRLKMLIEDLFEVSKASSGNMDVNMEDIDLIALIRQTLGEFEEEIEKSTLSFIKEVPNNKVIIYADGKKTFRVFQNIFSNILKYSMDNSRVYINVEEEEDFTSIVFRNISKYQLNLSEEEILERFKRGDSSRTTEGSGLGIAIAKSLVELQKGEFDIKVDGDLFKVNVKFKKIKQI